MSDRLDAIKVALALVPERDIEDWSMAYSDGLRTGRVTGLDLRWLVGEVRRLRETHAAAVEAAWREGALMILDWSFTSEDLNRMWLQSEARKGVARDE